MSKTATQEYELEEDTLAGEAIPPNKRSHHKKTGPGPGPGKAKTSETVRLVGEGLGAGIFLLTRGDDPRKGLSKQEAESIGVPIARMLGRRVPSWLKKLFPKTKLSPEDQKDLEEIGVTLVKWSLRLLVVAMEDLTLRMEEALAQRKASIVDSRPPTTARKSTPPPAPAHADVLPNNPFNALGVDVGGFEG